MWLLVKFNANIKLKILYDAANINHKKSLECLLFESDGDYINRDGHSFIFIIMFSKMFAIWTLIETYWTLTCNIYICRFCSRHLK